MFVGQQLFYFATIRKISVAFGSLFNNLYIQRFTQPGGKGTVLKTIHVPLSYAAGEKWYVHRVQDTPAQGFGVENQYKVQTKISLPRIGFELTGLQYDANRKLPTLNGSTHLNSSNVTTFLKQLNPVPYDFSFDVHIAVKNMDDGLQIIEQILPTFQPSYNLNVKDIPELQITKDVPILFQGITLADSYEGSFETERTLIWTLTFVVKGYMYPPIKDADIIRKVIANVYKDAELEQKQNVITVHVDPIDAAYDEQWQPSINTYTEEQLDSNGEFPKDSNGYPI